MSCLAKCLVDESSSCVVYTGRRRYRDNDIGVLPTNEAQKDGAKAIIDDEIDDWVHARVKVNEHGHPLVNGYAYFSYPEQEQEKEYPDGQPADEKQDSDYSACDRYTNCASLAPGRLLRCHCRLDGGDATGWIRNDARVLLSLAVDDDADDAAVECEQQDGRKKYHRQTHVEIVTGVVVHRAGVKSIKPKGLL